MADSFRPPAGVAIAAKRALRWIKEGHAGSGFTDVGRARAAQLAAREQLTLDTVKRMYSFFSRHEVDKKGADFNNLERPSPGRVAWDAWGGDAGYSWAKSIVRSQGEKMATLDTHSLFIPILKYDKQPDGTLIVRGIATDSSIDSDDQICDPDWLKTAMPAWFRWGNIREQHSNIAAGVAEEYENKDGAHHITVRVVDPSSVKKVENKVLKGFSVGISRARVSRDDKAAGGRIVDGEIVEVSLVDRPANPTCTLALAKSVNGALVETEELVEKRDVSEEERSQLAESGRAMPDGSFPIANRQDLKNAILAFGRAKNPDKVREHIIRRAHALDAEDLLPEKWTETKAMDEKAVSEESSAEESSAEESTAEESSAKKAAEESSQKPGEESSQRLGEESSRPDGVAGIAGKAEGDIYMCKTCGSKMAAVHDMISDLHKHFMDSASKSQSEDIHKALNEVVERVSVIEKTAASAHAPARMAVGEKKPAVNPDMTKAAEYRTKAMSTTDPRLAEGYFALALDLEKSL